ncbi:MAG: peptide ABC transporter substrate-binding protein, partial [Alphaproteobacteria bacterium]
MRTHMIVVAAVALPLTAAVAKDELVIGVGQFPTGFHPSLAGHSHVANSLVLGAARRPFTVYNADWELICMLCTELPSLDKGTARETTREDGSPGLAADYTIQADAVWGDGTPITTEDVLFTWEVGRTEEAGLGNQEMYRRIDRIEVHDDHRFTIHWDRRECGFEGINDFEVLPAHLEREAFSEPREYGQRTLYETDTTNPGLYFGPYRISRVELGALVVLEPNPTWWGEKPEFERITFRFIENTAALEANLLSGEVDYIAGEDGLTLDQALAFEKRHGDDYNVVFRSGLIYEHIDLMLDNPVLADLRVRRALLHAVDRAALSERLFEGKQPVAHTSVNPLDAVHFDGVPRYDFDPARAIALLEEAGWTDVRDGIRHNANGDRLS